MECIIESALKEFLITTLSYEAPAVELLSENMSGKIFLARDVNEQKIIIKTLKEKSLSELYGFNTQKQLVEYLRTYLHIVSSLPSSIPRPKIISANNVIIHYYDNVLFYLMEYTQGICKAINNIDLNQKLTIAKALSSIHQTDIANYNSEYWQIKTSFMANIWDDFLNNKMGDIIADISSHYVPGESLKNFIKKICITVTPHHLLSQDGQVCLCHTDIKPKNVLWDEKGKYILIDWEDLSLIRPGIDLIDTITSWTLRKDDDKYYFIQSEAIQFMAAYGLPITITELDILGSAAKWMVWITACYQLQKMEQLKDAVLMLDLLDKNYNNLMSLGCK